MRVQAHEHWLARDWWYGTEVVRAIGYVVRQRVVDVFVGHHVPQVSSEIPMIKNPFSIRHPLAFTVFFGLLSAIAFFIWFALARALVVGVIGLAGANEVDLQFVPYVVMSLLLVRFLRPLAAWSFVARFAVSGGVFLITAAFQFIATYSFAVYLSRLPSCGPRASFNCAPTLSHMLPGIGLTVVILLALGAVVAYITGVRTQQQTPRTVAVG